MTIDVQKELAEANARLPVDLTDGTAPLAMQMRVIALTIAQRHVGDSCIKEGGLYNALKMDGQSTHIVSTDDVIRASLVFERYLWGEWSKGIAENAINTVLTEAADVIEREFNGG
jgi:hypothetical protein